MTKRTIESEVKFEGKEWAYVLRFDGSSVWIRTYDFEGTEVLEPMCISFADFEQIQSEYARYTKMCAEMARDAA